MSNKKNNGIREDQVLKTIRFNVEMLRLEVEYMQLLIERHKLKNILDGTNLTGDDLKSEVSAENSVDKEDSK